VVTPVTARRVFRHGATTPLGERGQGRPHAAFAFVAQRAVVDVDTELGVARVVEVCCAEDGGRILDPVAAAGQVAGGTLQGIGLALFEELVFEDGRPRNGDFARYLVPTVADAPAVVTTWADAPAAELPLGVKGIGELATVASTAAIAAALRDATGAEVNRAPVTPEVLAGLEPPVTAPRPALDHLPRGVAPWLDALRTGGAGA
jgi:CO/xanthine dehydrogenase Mo-binding subunit